MDKAARQAKARAAVEAHRAKQDPPMEEVLAAALYGVLLEAHPVYPTTAGWRGGIGGQAITQGCSLRDGRPDHREPLEAIEGILRSYIEQNPQFNAAETLKKIGVEFK